MGSGSEIQRVRAPYLLRDSENKLGYRRYRRMSRCFAAVGTRTSATRLRSIAAGAPITSEEFTDVAFALIATETDRKLRMRNRRHAVFEAFVVTGVTLAMLSALIGVTFLLVFAMAHGY